MDLVLHVRPCEGLVRQLDGTVKKRFSKEEIIVPIQVPQTLKYDHQLRALVVYKYIVCNI